MNGSQYRLLTNTVLSLVGSGVVGFMLSRFYRGKFKWTDIQTCVIAGGIAMSSAHAIIIQGWTALMLGCLAAIWAFINLIWVQPWLQETFKLRDVRNVWSTFLMPGLFSAITGMIVLLIFVDSLDTTSYAFGQANNIFFARKPMSLRNVGALFASVAISVCGGVLSGLVVNYMREVIPHLDTDERLTDVGFFHVPITH